MRRPSSTSASRARYGATSAFLVGPLRALVPHRPRGALPLLLAFFGLSLASSMALDRWVFSNREWVNHLELGRWRERQWAARVDILREGGKRPDVVFTGDSSVGFGLQPSLAGTKGFNLTRPALACAELDQLSPRLERLVPRKPRAIVLGLMWFEFFPTEPELAFAQGHPPAWTRIAGALYGEPNLSQKKVYPGSRVARYWVDLHTHGEEGNRTPRGQKVDAEGHAVSFDPDLGSRLPHLGPETQPGWFQPSLLEPLVRFRDHWESKGVAVVFVFMPMHPGLKAQLMETAGADHAAWKAAVGEVMGGRCINAEDRFQDPHLFRDGTHLNAEGAKRMSVSLKGELGTLGLVP